jgi:hypothetical protein
MTIIGSKSTCFFIPWTSIRHAPLQQLKVTILGSIGACLEIPFITIHHAPLQQLK